MASAQSRCGHRAAPPPKWTINGNLVNCSKMSSRASFPALIVNSEVIQLSFGEDSVSLNCLQKRIVPSPFLPPLAKSPFRSPFPNLPVHSRVPLPPFVRQSQSPKKIAKIFLRSFRRHSQFLSAAAAASLARRRGLQGSLNLLRPPLLDRPCHPPPPEGIIPAPSGRRNGPILDEDDRVPV